MLNQARYADAQILVAGPNFGTGSSREHAVWALMDYGFRAVISSRFADIFRNNALKQGLIPVTVPEAVVHTILAAVEDDAATEIVVDVVEPAGRGARRSGSTSRSSSTTTRSTACVEGLDDIGITEQSADAITTFEAGRPAYLPSTA